MAIIYSRPGWKPVQGSPIDRSYGLASGLVFFAPLWEGAGKLVTDAVSGLALTLTGSGAAWGSGAQLGLSITANSSGASASAPAALQLPGPLTIACGFRPLGSSTTGATPFAVNYTNSGSTISVGLEWNAYPTLALVGYYSGTGHGIYSSVNVTAGNDYVAVGTITSGSQGFWLNGKSVGTGTQSAAITYGSVPNLTMGTTTSSSNTNSLVYWSAIWNRVLSSGEIFSLTANPWQVFTPRVSIANFGAGIIAGSFLPWIYGDQTGEMWG